MQISPISINKAPQFSSNDRDYTLVFPKTKEEILKEKAVKVFIFGMSIGAVVLICYKKKDEIFEFLKKNFGDLLKTAKQKEEEKIAAQKKAAEDAELKKEEDRRKMLREMKQDSPLETYDKSSPLYWES